MAARTVGRAVAAFAAWALAASPALAADVVLQDAWAEVPEGRAGEVVAYFTLVNRGRMTMLVGAESDLTDAVAILSDTDGRPGGPSRIVDRMMIAGDDEIVFEPGEYAVVLSRLRGRLAAGDRFTLRLAFADGTIVETEVVVAADGA